MLLLLLLFQHSTAIVPHQPKHIIKRIDSCPDVGYFFQRDHVPNTIDPGPCLLCFCKENNTAVCWRRDSSRCDKKNYRHYGKRETRQRRSPGLSDIFFRDAAREVFDRRTPEQCKPYESSFSEGCPPADWCIGCTVCDCDANGRWDCHILSFCPDKKGKKQIQKKKRVYGKNVKRSKINEEKVKKNEILKKITAKKVTQKAKTTIPPNKFINITHIKKSLKGPTQIKKNAKIIQKTTTKKAIDSNIINKKTTNQQIKRNAYKEALQNVNDKNDTYKLAEAIVKKVMSNVEKLMNENHKVIIQPKIHKSHMPKQNKTNVKKSSNKTENYLPRKHWIKKIKINQKPQPRTRDKRSVDTSVTNKTVIVDTTITLQPETIVSLLDVINISGTSTKTHYYRYEVKNITSTQKPVIVTAKTTNEIKNNTIISKNNVTLNQSTFNNTEDSNKQLHDLRIKHNNLIATKIKLNDKWKDLQTLLSMGMNEKYKGIKMDFNVTDNNKHIKCGKLCTFKKVFKKIIYGADSNSSDIYKAKIKKISLVTTLKNFFKPLLTKIKPRTKKFIHTRNNKNILSTLCKKFELCKPDLSDKLLQFKLAELNRETLSIFKIVSSIKGLLHLLNTTGNSSETEIRDVEKLDQILKKLYTFEKDETNVTETKRIQIKYVKQNIREFVKSLEKFAFTLKDIIHILQNQNKVSAIKNTNSHRKLRCAKHLSTTRNQKIDDKLTKLKNLLLNYNLLQNRFMSKMYDILSNSENADGAVGVEPKVSEKRVFNSSFEVESYSRNIIENLRKLQLIGQKLSSSARVKRKAMNDDDAIDYLLMLMEYLLKQNRPTPNPQVSDGIDLLIDAIKNAPDIKPITFDTIHFTTFRTPTRTMFPENDLFSMKERNQHIKGKHSKKIYAETESFDDTIDDPDQKNSLKGNEMLTTPFHSNKIRDDQVENADIVGGDVVNSSHVYFNKNPAEVDTFLKENSDKKSPRTKYEVYNADDDEEDDLTNVIHKKLDGKEDTYIKAEIDIEKEHEKILNRVNSVVDDKTVDNKNETDIVSVKDWEIDIDLKAETTTKVTTKRLQVTRTRRRQTDKYLNPISGISSEERELDNHSKPIMHSTSKLKKVDIFNSFDYNTERTDVDSESKEDKNDAFSDFA